jgi:hypothetical protein
VAEETAIVVGEQESTATAEAAATKAIADDVQRDLDEALPALDQAVGGEKVKPAEITTSTGTTGSVAKEESNIADDVDAAEPRLSLNGNLLASVPRTQFSLVTGDPVTMPSLSESAFLSSESEGVSAQHRA